MTVIPKSTSSIEHKIYKWSKSNTLTHVWDGLDSSKVAEPPDRQTDIAAPSVPESDTLAQRSTIIVTDRATAEQFPLMLLADDATYYGSGSSFHDGQWSSRRA
jgi:hypothetical protein